MIKSLNKFSKLIACGALATASFGIAQAEDETVKVGVLHSLSGTMAISETSLRDILLFTFDEINASGGVLGKQIEPVVADGASDWPVFAEKAEQLLAQDGVSAIFGCWTSVSRKFALPVVEKYKGLLFYPVQYEGEEESPNIIYTAEAVGQQAIPAVDYLLAEGYKKFYLIGTDYVYPQTTNIVLFEYLLSKGIPVENIGGGIRYEGDVAVSAGNYTPFGHTDFQQIVADIKDSAASGEACVINTINGDANVPFFKEIAASGNGSYVRASNANAGLGIIMEEIDKMEKKEFGSKSFKDYEDRFQIFLIIAFILIVIEYFISNRRSSKLDGVNLFETKK